MPLHTSTVVRVLRRLPRSRVLAPLRRVGARLVERPGSDAMLTRVRRSLGSPATVVLELGANDGTDSLRLAAAFPAAVVHCFEPDPRPLAILRSRATDPRIRVHPYAIGSANGPITFHQSGGIAPEGERDVPGGWHQSGSIRAPKSHLTEFPWVTFDTDITVESVTLDTWTSREGLGTIDLIWADVQGAERDVIEGGAASLQRTRLLFLEYSNNEQYEGQATLAELLALLPNWRVLRDYGTDVLLENTALSGH